MRAPVSLSVALLLAACAQAPTACAPVGHYASPATLRRLADPLAGIGHDRVILLGESHDRAQDHQWELAAIERVYDATPGLVLGFEMFPRADQPVLDRWVNGQLTEAAFLEQSDWKHVWGFDPSLYMPIFEFAREHHIPMLALNVSARTIHLVSKAGFAGVAMADREGVGTPAPPSPAYREELADVMGGHAGMTMTPDRLQHFIDAQLTWDRAMAEAIARQRAMAPDRPVVAIMGAGHLENRYGVPHQLEALGVNDALVLIASHDFCAPLGRIYADGVYVD
jgi:uncharacterized iron-regulated protein